MQECRLGIFEEKPHIISKEVMERKFWKSFVDADMVEPTWFTKNIKKEISIRRNYNKEKRKVINSNEKEIYETLYQQQKKKVQILVNEAMKAYEKKLTKEIKTSQNRSKNLHMYIKKLRGETIINNSDIEIYDTQGNKLEQGKMEKN